MAEHVDSRCRLSASGTHCQSHVFPAEHSWGFNEKRIGPPPGTSLPAATLTALNLDARVGRTAFGLRQVPRERHDCREFMLTQVFHFEPSSQLLIPLKGVTVVANLDVFWFSVKWKRRLLS